MSDSTRKTCAAAGFTRIEILVALLILGIMSALGYGTYRAARISAERTEESVKRSREIEFGMRIMVQDIAQTVPRPVRDIVGGPSRLPALHGWPGTGTLSPIPSSSSGSGTSSSSSSSSMSFTGMSFKSSSDSKLGSGPSSDVAPLLDLTRIGWSNTAGQQRSTLQRVSYGLVDDVLKRSYQVNLDAVQGNKPVVQDLFTGVKAIQLRYLDSTNQTWLTEWPPPSLPKQEGDWNRPVAVELIIEFKDWGRIRRVIEVAG
ncbi:MAG: type II secretion system minor pseudopilin GspJ [Steroidobacteraceae bacterium]